MSTLASSSSNNTPKRGRSTASIKRSASFEYAKPPKKAKSTSPGEGAPKVPTRGAQAYLLPPSCAGLPYDSPVYIERVNTMIHTVRAMLATEGKSISRQPVILNDEKGVRKIVFDWVLDRSAKKQSSPSPERNIVLVRDAVVPLKWDEPDPRITPDISTSVEPDGVGLSAANPFVVDDDDPPPLSTSTTEVQKIQSGFHAHLDPDEDGSDNLLEVSEPAVSSDLSNHTAPEHLIERERSPFLALNTRQVLSTATIEHVDIELPSDDSDDDSGDWEAHTADYRDPAVHTTLAALTLPDAAPSGPSDDHRQARQCQPTSSTTPPASRGHRPVKSGSSQAPPTKTPRKISNRDDAVLHRQPIPKGELARPRRILVPGAQTRLPIMTVDLRGDCQFLHRKKHYRISEYSMPLVMEDSKYRKIQDTCLVGDTAVLGWTFTGDWHGSCQISIVALDTDAAPKRFDLNERAHSIVVESSVGYARRNRAISSLAGVTNTGQSTIFVSGGYDRFLFLWSIKPREGAYRVRVQKFGFQAEGAVQALAYNAHKSLLYSAAGTSIYTSTVEASARSERALVSNSARQIHVHPENASLVLLEVDHLDQQVQLFDIRTRGFNREPSVSFGHRYDRPVRDQRSEPRSVRGDVSETSFTRGYKDGIVKVWDFRNSKVQFIHDLAEPIYHTVFTGSSVAAYTRDAVTFLDPSRGSA